MTRAGILSDRVWRGLGTAARSVGESTDAYRPADTGDPLRLANRFLRLPTLIKQPRLRSVRAGGFGEALWEGVFDAAYTRPGDYLVRADGAIWFVAAQLPMQSPLCVRTLRRLKFTRPSGQTGAGATPYGGVASEPGLDVLTSWPAAMATPSNSGQTELATATPLRQAIWTVLLPPFDWLGLLPGDAMKDDLGRAGVVEMAEVTELGWRLVIRQSTS